MIGGMYVARAWMEFTIFQNICGDEKLIVCNSITKFYPFLEIYTHACVYQE